MSEEEFYNIDNEKISKTLDLSNELENEVFELFGKYKTLSDGNRKDVRKFIDFKVSQQENNEVLEAAYKSESLTNRNSDIIKKNLLKASKKKQIIFGRRDGL